MDAEGLGLDEMLLSSGDVMAMIDLIGELLYRFFLLVGLLYALDYALDGKLDLPHRKMEWEELRIARWINRIWRAIKIKLLKKRS